MIDPPHSCPSSTNGKKEPAIPYEFGYSIKDGHGSSNFRKEGGDHANNKWGSYGMQDRDGTWRLVHYVADKHGFRVKIDSNEPGVISSNPAHAHITGPDVNGYTYHQSPHAEPHAPLRYRPHEHGHGHGHRHQEQGYHHVRHEYQHKQHEHPVRDHNRHEYNEIYDGHNEHRPHVDLHQHMHEHKSHGYEGHVPGLPELHAPVVPHSPHVPERHGGPDSLLNYIPDVPLGPPEGVLDLKKAASGLMNMLQASTTPASSQTESSAAAASEGSLETSTAFISKRVSTAATAAVAADDETAAKAASS